MDARVANVRPEVVKSVVECLESWDGALGDAGVEVIQASAFFSGIEYALIQINSQLYADHITTMQMVKTMLIQEEAIAPVLRAFRRVQEVVPPATQMPDFVPTKPQLMN